MKTVFIVLSVIVLCQLIPFSRGANFTLCEIGHGDYELYSDTLVLKGKKEQTIAAYVEYPPKGPPKATVHCIMAYDNAADEQNEGTVSIVQGGLDEQYVNLMIVSQPGGGLDFEVVFYGH